MDSPPVDNQTEFELHPQLIMARDGERLIAVVKATFELLEHGQPLSLAPSDRARPVRMSDEPWGEPEIESIQYPSDICPQKPGTDVIIVASAVSPNQTPELDCYARVGELKKALKVYGLRVWESRGAGLSSARPFTSLELRYDYAWGGHDFEDPERPSEEARNPIGRGVVSQQGKLTHQPGPHIEDPDHPIRSATTKPPPAGVGAIGRSFAPRRYLAGTYDESWQELRAPLPPKDESDDFFQVASPGLVAKPHLRGGEECAFLNMHPWGPIQFTLPSIALAIEFQIRGRAAETILPPLDTVLVDLWNTNDEKPIAVEMVWRAHVRAPRKMNDSLTIVREVGRG